MNEMVVTKGVVSIEVVQPIDLFSTQPGSDATKTLQPGAYDFWVRDLTDGRANPEWAIWIDDEMFGTSLTRIEQLEKAKKIEAYDSGGRPYFR